MAPMPILHPATDMRAIYDNTGKTIGDYKMNNSVEIEKNFLIEWKSAEWSRSGRKDNVK